MTFDNQSECESNQADAKTENVTLNGEEAEIHEIHTADDIRRGIPDEEYVVYYRSSVPSIDGDPPSSEIGPVGYVTDVQGFETKAGATTRHRHEGRVRMMRMKGDINKPTRSLARRSTKKGLHGFYDTKVSSHNTRYFVVKQKKIPEFALNGAKDRGLGNVWDTEESRHYGQVEEAIEAAAVLL